MSSPYSIKNIIAEFYPILIIIFFLSIIMFAAYHVNKVNTAQEQLIECQMQLPSNEAALKDIDGISFGDQYFCIKTAGQTYSEVMEVCNHEYMHTSGQMEDSEPFFK